MRRRAGFTLIELMVVIGIILLLVSIVTFGFRHVQAQAARHETFAEMNICEGMLKEYGSVSGMANITDPPPPPPSPTPPKISPPLDPTVSYQVPIYLDAGIASGWGIRPTFLLPDDTAGTSSIGDYSTRGASDSRYTAPAVLRTQAIMFILLRDPKNRTMLAAIPARRLMEGLPDPTTNINSSIPIDYSMILDAWGNPIIFVPKGGMVVWMNQSGIGSYYMIRSSGAYICQADGTFKNILPSSAVNDQPFFASAGQDGIFSDPAGKTDNGVDNIYSFQQ